MARLNYGKMAPEAIRGLRGVENYARQSGLETPLLELVRLRASQINGCAYCVDMHTKDARAGGDRAQRLYCLSVWRETPFYTEREQAALAWTEAVTNISKSPIEDELYERVLKSFPEKQLVDLTMAVIAINSWNRLAIPFQSEPGHYQPPARKAE